MKAAPGVAHYITSKARRVGITRHYRSSSLLMNPGAVDRSVADQTEGRVAFLDRYTTPTCANYP